MAFSTRSPQLHKITDSTEISHPRSPWATPSAASVAGSLLAMTRGKRIFAYIIPSGRFWSDAFFLFYNSLPLRPRRPLFGAKIMVACGLLVGQDGFDGIVGGFLLGSDLA